jgi:hypothetical protein
LPLPALHAPPLKQLSSWRNVNDTLPDIGAPQPKLLAPWNNVVVRPGNLTLPLIRRHFWPLNGVG